MISNELATLTPDNALRLSRGISTSMTPESIADRLDKLDQMYELWNSFRASRLAAGKPGPYDLPPKNIRPITFD